MLKERTLRGRALKKLAAISVPSSDESVSYNPLFPASNKLDFDRLCEACPAPQQAQQQVANGTLSTNISNPSAVGRVPMSLRELEVLLALCDATPSLKTLPSANHLLDRISPYVPESCYQALAPSPFLQKFKPSPWETLTFSLVDAVLRIGLAHPSLRDKVAFTISEYVENCTQLASYLTKPSSTGDSPTVKSIAHQEFLGVLTLAASLVGFLKASSKFVHFWTQEEQNDLLQSLQSILSNDFLLTTEAALSSVRNSRATAGEVKEWRHYLRHYLTEGQPMGAMLLQQEFMEVVEACASLMVLAPEHLKNGEILDTLMMDINVLAQPISKASQVLVEALATIAAREILNLEEGSDYLQLSSAWQNKMAQSVKASSLTTFLCCSLVSEEVAEPEVLMSWLETSLSDASRTADGCLARVVLRCMALLATTSTLTASNVNRSMIRLLIRGSVPPDTSSVAAKSLLFVLKLLPQDTTITTLYSLGNSLSVNNGGEYAGAQPMYTDGALDANHNGTNGDARMESTAQLPLHQTTQSANTHNTVILAIVAVARGLGDEKITALALSMLVQKVGKVNVAVDLTVITEAAVLAAEAGPAEFQSVLRLYSRLHQDATSRNDLHMIRAVAEARDYLSVTLKGGPGLYAIYLYHLLETVVSKGEVEQFKEGQATDFESAAQELALLLRPLALLVANNVGTEGIEDVESFPALQRDAWYNIVVHGFTPKSLLGKRHRREIQVLARYCHPLISEELAGRLESDIELNTVLRRGMSSDNTAKQRKEIADLLPQMEDDVKSLDYPQLIFLKAAYLVETSRAASGQCSIILGYFVDGELRDTALGECVAAVALEAVDIYLAETLNGIEESFSAPHVAEQLSLIFEACCHRVENVQRVAFRCADRILEKVPSSLCQRSSLFALLDLLTIMWEACLEAELDEYEWKSFHTSRNGATNLQLSDNYPFRRYTLYTFHRRAKEWMVRTVNNAALDIKGLLQTYLSEFGDDEAFGHMSLGRSLAFEMGAMISKTDHRLGAIEKEQELHINTASDFMAQYTTRQEYRFTDPLGQDVPPNFLDGSIDSSLQRQPGASSVDIVVALAQMETRLLKREIVPSSDLRDLLRRAASLLCRASGDESTVVSHFVRIPFVVFSKQLINFGLSLWMGVIKENPRMEPRILIEIVEGWITTVRGRLGIFNPSMTHIDPFFLKEEFAPSDKAETLRQQQRAHDLIAPHFRVLQFLTSHYTATRLSNSATEKAYHRFLKITLRGLRDTAAHPLAREVHFSVILLGLKFLRHNVSLNAVAEWRLKDDILSAGLAWFAQPPRFSFGGNRLQIKAETHVLADVANAVHQVSNVGTRTTPSLKSLQQKQDLLQALLSDEQTRLMVWLFPLDHAKKHHFTAGHHNRVPVDTIGALLRTAWEENANIAINLAPRYKSPPLNEGIRWFLLNYPEKAMGNADALRLLLGSSLPNDVTSQLKLLLYWAPVNPITAVTFFLPAYKNHPCIIQYAVRALDHHSVDVTFFFVPQIVQALRYDVLGYVERYIIETAKFSQLFAHQIIWNMKANAYKDEDSKDPDPVKPTLDKVTESLIASFSPSDRQFYEREFSFFNEITGISGKLRPYIKKSKPEKKQKIEEELRQIHVDVGVYLPSNPDGIVVGIDRKSGKPLQSHAKAPYMATFRIRKESKADAETTNEPMMSSGGSTYNNSTSYEVWQSAIFKVGDDCRQDVLALQMIAAFRGIFHFVGLPVYVFPYRVTATAPGCGVIDVLPNSISRDMLGREAVNGLYDWFASTFGGEDAPDFQVARANFVKSLAAYSIISYLLQFKDRHNGNIMFDEQGHILHIDFGFCFDIAPGGVKFERAPFKLTKEMIAVMGGSAETQSFQWFEELCVKAFLAARPFVDTLSHIIACMLDSGLPCFKPETIQHFRERFVPEKTEREAADFVRGLVSKSYGNYMLTSPAQHEAVMQCLHLCTASETKLRSW